MRTTGPVRTHTVRQEEASEAADRIRATIRLAGRCRHDLGREKPRTEAPTVPDKVQPGTQNPEPKVPSTHPLNAQHSYLITLVDDL